MHICWCISIEGHDLVLLGPHFPPLTISEMEALLLAEHSVEAPDTAAAEVEKSASKLQLGAFDNNCTVLVEKSACKRPSNFFEGDQWWPLVIRKVITPPLLKNKWQTIEVCLGRWPTAVACPCNSFITAIAYMSCTLLGSPLQDSSHRWSWGLWLTRLMCKG